MCLWILSAAAAVAVVERATSAAMQTVAVLVVAEQDIKRGSSHLSLQPQKRHGLVTEVQAAPGALTPLAQAALTVRNRGLARQRRMPT